MKPTKERIADKYIRFVATHDKQPPSVIDFADSLKIKEGTFYRHFSSFNQLEKDIWANIFRNTLRQLEKDEEYLSFSVGEKFLAFFYTWTGMLKDYRSFVVYSMKEEGLLEVYPACMEDFRKEFEKYAGRLVSEGINTGEIAHRPWLTERYKDLFWYQVIYVLKFWVKDKSNNFEDTDALIEKSVKFLFDIVGPNGVDSFADLAKFHLQHL